MNIKQNWAATISKIDKKNAQRSIIYHVHVMNERKIVKHQDEGLYLYIKWHCGIFFSSYLVFIQKNGKQCLLKIKYIYIF